MCIFQSLVSRIRFSIFWKCLRNVTRGSVTTSLVRTAQEGDGELVRTALALATEPLARTVQRGVRCIVRTARSIMFNFFHDFQFFFFILWIFAKRVRALGFDKVRTAPSLELLLLCMLFFLFVIIFR